MTGTTPRVIVIPPKPELARSKAVQRQLRVAAYCRVSTDDEEQLTSYEAQQTYYTDKIMTNPQWTMAGIFADEGITGTSAQKRPEFQRMIRRCRQKKIDLVLVKSISRFARNTVACGNVSVRSARLLPGLLTCHRSRHLASLRSVQGARPLRRSAAIPMMLHYSLPAGHAKHGAAPTGAFGWTQSGQSGAWGNPNKLHRNIENDIPMQLVPSICICYNIHKTKAKNWNLRW